MKPWLAVLTACLAAVMLPNSARPATLDRIIIVKSSENRFYGQTIETLSRRLDPGQPIDVVLADDLARSDGSGQHGRLYIALGRTAADALDKRVPGADSINAYLTLEEYEQRDSRNLTVLLDQPLRRYLAFCKLLLQAQRVGLILPSRLHLDTADNRGLAQLDLALNQYPLDPDRQLLPVLREALRQNDAMLLLPRQAIYNRDTLKGLLLTSLRGRKPVISYSPAHVRAGALASIYSSPVDIGNHLAWLINRRLANSAPPDEAYQFARFYTIKTNPSVATALELDLPRLAELRDRLDRVN